MLRYEGRLTPLWYYFGSYTTRTQRPDGLCKVETKKDSASAQELLAKQVGTYDEPEVCTSMAPKVNVASIPICGIGLAAVQGETGQGLFVARRAGVSALGVMPPCGFSSPSFARPVAFSEMLPQFFSLWVPL
jgi:hypothetical protein